MGIDKLKKKPNQLVSKGKDNKRPGYRGRTDADTMSGSGYGAGSSSSSSDSGGNGGGYDYEYVAYNPPSPAPSPEPDTSEDDFVNPLDEFGIKGNVYADTVYDDGDEGEELYVSPTLKRKQQIPYMDYKPGPNYVTADELSRLNRGIGDSDERISTLAKIQAVNPIQQPTGILQKAGTTLKNMAIDYALNAFTGGLYGRLKTPYNIAQAVDNRLLGDRVPKITELAKFVPQGTCDRRPDTATGYQSDGDDRPIPKNVIAANVQKFSPEQLNRAILIRDQLQTASEQGVQLNKENQMTLRGLNQLIEKYQVDKPETMVT